MLRSPVLAAILRMRAMSALAQSGRPPRWHACIAMLYDTCDGFDGWCGQSSISRSTAMADKGSSERA